jgi:hypothetical protein
VGLAQDEMLHENLFKGIIRSGKKQDSVSSNVSRDFYAARSGT